jgi:hypothetical protein
MRPLLLLVPIIIAFRKQLTIATWAVLIVGVWNLPQKLEIAGYLTVCAVVLLCIVCERVFGEPINTAPKIDDDGWMSHSSRLKRLGLV